MPNYVKAYHGWTPDHPYAGKSPEVDLAVQLFMETPAIRQLTAEQVFRLGDHISMLKRSEERYRFEKTFIGMDLTHSSDNSGMDYADRHTDTMWRQYRQGEIDPARLAFLVGETS